jgi:hypothetical protein
MQRENFRPRPEKRLKHILSITPGRWKTNPQSKNIWILIRPRRKQKLHDFAFVDSIVWIAQAKEVGLGTKEGLTSKNQMASEKGLRFELWREDDNGNRFLIGVFTDRDAARQRLAELTQNPHKQIYWISEKPAGPGEKECLNP